MNSDSNCLPGIWTLRRHDRVLEKSTWLAFFGLVVAVGTRWVSNGVVPGPNTPDFEMKAFQIWVPTGGLVVSVVAATIAVWRHGWVKKVFSQGTLVTGMVEDLERQDTNSRLDSQGRNITTYIYFAVLRYEMHGRERKVRIRLPNSGTTYGIVKGGETDLMVLDAAPDKPLIRAVYLGGR